MSNLQLIDDRVVGQMRSMIGDAYDGIVKQFFATTPDLLDEIHQACHQHDADKMIELAHKIKSGSGSIGFSAVNLAAADIERSLREDPATDVTEKVQCLDDCFQQTREEGNDRK